MAYIPPHRRKQQQNPPVNDDHQSLLLVNDPLTIDGQQGIHIFPHSAIAPTIGETTNNQTYMFWMVLHEREADSWCSIFHRGDSNSHRCPGFWLNKKNNKFHFRASTTSHPNFGKSESFYEVTVGTPVHVACVINGTENYMALYVNGVLDFQKKIGQEEFFLPGKGPLYLGRNIWHGSSRISFAKFSIANAALSDGFIKSMYDSQVSLILELSGRIPTFDDPILENIHHHGTKVANPQQDGNGTNQTSHQEDDNRFIIYQEDLEVVRNIGTEFDLHDGTGRTLRLWNHIATVFDASGMEIVSWISREDDQVKQVKASKIHVLTS